MGTQYLRKSLGDGVAAAFICDPKYKSNSVTVRLLTEYDFENAAALALIPSFLSSCSREYPDGTAFSKKLNSLYGASIFGSVSQIGDAYELLIAADFLADRFTLDGEIISAEVLRVLIGCISEPALEDGGFLKSEFEIRRNDLLDVIDGSINDKTAYALSLAYETAFAGEAAARKYYGSRSQVETVTPQRAYEVYKKLLSEAEIEISFCGCEDLSQYAAMFETLGKGRGERGYKPKNLPYISYSKQKPETAYVSRLCPVSQTNLVLAFKPKNHDLFAAQLLSTVYGDSPFSRLFAVVREKMSLCYFCSSVYSATKGALFVISGVEDKNAQRLEREAVNQLRLIAEGDLSEDELISAKRCLVSSLRSVTDRVSSLDSWYANCRVRGDSLTPKEYIEKIMAVTKEEIAALAAEMQLDTVFILKNGNAEDLGG